MAKMQREKGKRFERFIADQLRQALPKATVHRTIQSHAAFQADVTVEGEAPRIAKDVWLELTDAQKPDVSAKLAQAERDATLASTPTSPRYPMVVWKKSGSRSVYASMRLWVLGKLLGFRPGAGETEMVTLGWTVILEAFKAADAVRGRVAEASEAIGRGKWTVEATGDGVTIGAVYGPKALPCKAPPKPAQATPALPPMRSDHHIPDQVPKLQYIPAPTGFPEFRLIAGQRWDIKYSPELLSFQGAFGATFPGASLIVIDSNSAPAMMRKILLHELIHACFATGAQNFLTESEEEDSVRLLTTTMHSMLPQDWWLLA